MQSYKIFLLGRYWCMRFEGKHSYFKNLSHRVSCFKNIPKTLANRHQNMICYFFGTVNETGSPFGKSITVGTCEKILS